jgi:drug/metabolite transporter superfamily protein YnfA
MVMAEGRYELDFRCYWWFYLISIWYSPTFQPSYFVRTYAAYGGIVIISSIVWGIIADEKKPYRFEIIGSLVALSGAIIIFYIPR